jgi:hypothetical protein
MDLGRNNRAAKTSYCQIEHRVEEELLVNPVKPAPQINVLDAIQWLNTCAERAMGEDPGIDRFPIAAPYSEPKVLVAENTEGQRFLLSAHTPDAIRRIPAPGRWPWPFSRLSRSRSNPHPLVPLSRHVKTFQLSTINCGADFEYDAMHVWKRLTGEDLFVKQLWLYVLPHTNG